MDSSCHNLQAICWWIEIDFRLGVMSIYHLSITKGHIICHWTNKLPSSFNIPSERLAHLFLFLLEVCGYEYHQLWYIGWLANPLLSCVWFGYLDWRGMKLMTTVFHKWFRLSLVHWLYPWRLKLSLVAMQPHIIFLLEEPYWKNIFLGWRMDNGVHKCTFFMLADSTSKGSTSTMGNPNFYFDNVKRL